MKRVRRGFTLIEVSLFLVITAAVFVGVAVGTQNSIFQQRYNDAVQNFAEFLRSVYSQVTNVQSENTGRSNKAIYGKLVTFNENAEKNNVITSYNVIGDINDSCDGDVLQKLRCLQASVVIDDNPVGFVENYVPRWASQIQTTASWSNEEGEEGYRVFTGALLIARSPSTGTVYTYMTDREITDINNAFTYKEVDGAEEESLLDTDNPEGFKQVDVDFCVNPNGTDRSTLRRDIRIIKGARNASGVEIISDDDSRCGD